MAAGEPRAFGPSDGRRVGIRTLVLSLIVFVVAMAGLAASPALLESLYPADQGHAEIGNVGQAYGAASAMVAGLALFVVAASVFVQYRQLRAIEIQALSEFNEELVLLAMESPRYRQCWGSRVSPPGIGRSFLLLQQGHALVDAVVGAGKDRRGPGTGVSRKIL